jgi:hypothetical protein
MLKLRRYIPYSKLQPLRPLYKPSGITYLTVIDLPKAKTPPYPFYKISVLLLSLVAKV